MQALYLIEAFESLYPKSAMWQFLLDRGFSMDTLRTVWKKKVLFILGKTSMLKQDYKDALEFLEKALELGVDDEKGSKEINDLISQVNAKLQKEKKAEKNMLKKAFDKNQEVENGADKLTETIINSSPIGDKSPSKSAKPVSVIKKKSQDSSAKKKDNNDSADSKSIVPTVSWTTIGICTLAAISIAGIFLFRGRAVRR